MILDQNREVLVASVICFQKIFGLHGLAIKSLNTWSVEGGTGWYSVLLGQNRAVLVASMMSFQKIYGLHGLDHQIIEYSK